MPDKPYEVDYRPPSRKTIAIVVAIVVAVVALGIALRVGSERAVAPSRLPSPSPASPATTWFTLPGHTQFATDPQADDFTYAVQVKNAVDRPLTILSVSPLPAEHLTVVTQAVVPATGANFEHPPPIGSDGVVVASGATVYVFVRVHVDCAQAATTQVLGLSVKMRDGTTPVGQFLPATSGSALDTNVTTLPTKACD